MERPNYITPAGYAALRAEYEALFAKERPALVDTIAWAAGNGDRSAAEANLATCCHDLGGF